MNSHLCRFHPHPTLPNQPMINQPRNITDLDNIISQINHHHMQAHQKAIEAVEEARKAGFLLLELKKALPHGSFHKWIEANLTVSVRQAQRYIAVAQGKTVPIRQLAGKHDTVSHLEPKITESVGIWENDHWRPEPSCSYLFYENDASYWVTNSPNGAFHVCKHYSGQPMFTKNFYWRYTIFSPIKDPDFTSDFYIGTRSPIHNASGIEGVLKSYGLVDLKNSLVFGFQDLEGSDRPFGEPDPEDWYWDKDEPNDQLFQTMKKMNYINVNGSIVLPD